MTSKDKFRSQLLTIVNGIPEDAEVLSCLVVVRIQFEGETFVKIDIGESDKEERAKLIFEIEDYISKP